MAKQPEKNPQGASNVVPIFGQAATPVWTARDEAFRRRRTMLTKYLRLRLGVPVEAHDVAQANFVRLWERVDTLHGDNVEALLFVTARNLANDLVRGRARPLDIESSTSGFTGGDMADHFGVSHRRTTPGAD